MDAKSFNCPTCGAPLDYDGGPNLTIRCPFCHNTVIVPGELRISHPPAAGPDAEQMLQQIRQMLMADQKIEAVKLIRLKYNIGLREALEVVEKVEIGGPLVIPEKPQSKPVPDMDEIAILQQIQRLLAAGQKIEAIKLYRQHYPVGLKEAKDTVELINAGMLKELPQKQIIMQRLITRIAQLDSEKKPSGYVQEKPPSGSYQSLSGDSTQKPSGQKFVAAIAVALGILFLGIILLLFVPELINLVSH